MIDLERDCEMIVLSEEQSISNFDCGNDDLNDFFNHDALQYRRQMLSQTCFFRHKSGGAVVCAFSYSASSIKTADLPGSRRKKVKEYVPKEKSLKSYPAILIGRLGVATKFSGQGVGSQLIEAIKNFCLINFPDFVRFLLVDAYNEPIVLGFYQKNDFAVVFSTEKQEKEAYRQSPSESLQTRYMFYDMMQWRNKMT
ncbi:MAG: GNAT family N-acetyltransferase [Candidatus Azobacteroides sp.]|nr:GNAT family N-acetyltransferase [Candidatus Azobacteroides sp.]